MHQTFHQSYIDFFTYFNGNEDYFECHEVFEELWKEVDSGNKSHVLVGFIQIATGLYHWRRGNIAGAKRSIGKGISIIEKSKPSSYTDPMDLIDFITKSKHALLKIEQNEPFKPFKIILVNNELQQTVEQKITELPKSDPHFIHNKHTLRDRSEVIAERAKKLALKQK